MTLISGSELAQPLCDAHWKRSLDRDAAADGTFVYGVKTTGVYCRPSCPSRAPHRHNAVFFPTSRDAEADGYRACYRCNSDGLSTREVMAERIAEACRTIETAYALPTLAELAAGAGLSTFHFHRRFKAMTGLTPRAYAEAHRAKRVRTTLTEKMSSVTDAIYGAGFNSSSRFYETASERLGMTPKAFRKGGKGAKIHFATNECSLGAILVARSEKGICAITLGDEQDALVRDLEFRFPNATLVRGDGDFKELVARVVSFVEEPQMGLDLPLDVQGTAFEERVWQALREIPAGKTASYADVASRIGAPGSARAVARACAANKIAVAIPCHRVVRGNGELSGYRWGVDRKQALLTKEASS
jgi:AraC family transcriptional regulator, regulatory protein of adaptative response / methylated-DNA-[protein]-cysteine methyltransferase